MKNRHRIIIMLCAVLLLWTVPVTADRKLDLKLSYAVDGSRTRMAANLIRAGADVNAADSDGWPVFITVVNSGNIAMISLFLRNRVNVDISGPDKRTPLMHAIANDNKNTVKLLLKSGADVNATDNQGETVLMYAAENGAARLVKTLIRRGANVYERDNARRNALSHAVQFRHKKVIRILGEYETRPDDFLMAVDSGDTVAARRILSKGIDVNLKNSRGEPPIFIAVKKNDTIMTRLLIKHGAKLNFANSDGHTLLMYTFARKRFRMAKLLMRNGARADFNFRYRDGLTALMLSLKNRNRILAKLILKYRQNLDVQDNDGNTALMYATVLGMSNLVRQILKKGADPLIVRKDKRTAYDIAKQKNHLFIQRILKKSMQAHMVN